MYDLLRRGGDEHHRQHAEDECLHKAAEPVEIQAGEGRDADLEQLDLARKAKDVTFYDQSVIDAREREWKAIVRDDLKKR